MALFSVEVFVDAPEGEYFDKILAKPLLNTNLN